MRLVIYLACLSGLLIGEALYQRRLHALSEFKRALETMRASLGSWNDAFASLRWAHERFAQAARRVLAEARRREQDHYTTPPKK